jgi:hypothetical protein
LQIKRAFTSQNGPDAEELNTITAVTPAGFGIAYADTRGTVAVRRVLSPDSLAARTYLIGFDRRVPTVVPGSTSLGISRAILMELRQTAKSRVALMHDVALNTIDGILTLRRRNIQVPVLVENQVIFVPAMHVKGVFRKGPRTGIGDFYFLDNKKRPLVLEYVIKFSWEKRARTVRTIRVSAGRSQQAAMAQTLKTYRKLDLYGIHFNFDKATIRAETRGLISDIAKTLQVNPGWTLEIRGHTVRLATLPIMLDCRSSVLMPSRHAWSNVIGSIPPG